MSHNLPTVCHNFLGWDDRLEEKEKFFQNLHEKLVIIIPQSGRSLESIPGCNMIACDESKLRKYNAIRGDLTKLEDGDHAEEYARLPALWINNEKANRNYMTTIYEIKDEPEVCIQHKFTLINER